MNEKVTVTKYSGVRYISNIRSSSSTEGMPEEAGRAEEHIITDAALNDLKIGEGA